MGLVNNGMAFLASRPAVTKFLLAADAPTSNTSIDGGKGNWKLDTGVSTVKSTMETVVPLIITIIGGVATVAGVYKIVTGLISHGKGQPTSWPVAIILLVVGLALLFTGIGALNGASASNVINTTLGFS